MAGRRRGTQLLTSIYRAVEAQLATASSQSFTCPQLTSLYSDLLQPQHLTCLRHFNTSSTPLFTTTTSVAEVNIWLQPGHGSSALSLLQALQLQTIQTYTNFRR